MAIFKKNKQIKMTKTTKNENLGLHYYKSWFKI